METLHATCVVVEGKGVLLCGPPGSGKSDLALRLIDGGATLVADDVVAVKASGGTVIASFPDGPDNLKGVIEVRGLGLVRVVSSQETPVTLCVHLSPLQIARLPEAVTSIIAGLEIPALTLSAFESSTPAKIRAALIRERVAIDG